MRFQCLDCLHKVYEEMNNWEDGGTSSFRLGHYARKHLMLYRNLSEQTRSPLLWHMCPKHHVFLHVCEGCLANPKLHWNYGDESEIGAAVAMAKTANQGCVEFALLRRYRATFELQSVP